MTLTYLGNMWQGVWLTIGTFSGWLSFFNLGLGNGLRNKLAQSLASNDIEASRKYVSSTYYIIGLISMGLLLILLPVVFLVDWTVVFNVGPEYEWMLRKSMLFFVVFFCMQFVMSLISIVLTADQKPAMGDVMEFLGSLFFFAGIAFLYFAHKYGMAESSVAYVVLISGLFPVLIYFGFTMYYFKGKYKHISPSLKYVDATLLWSLANLGLKFFVVQIAVVVLFTSDNMIITQLFGPAEVVPYSTSRKFFGIVEMGFYIMLGPFWSAFTAAYFQGDISWVRSSITKLLKLLVLLTVGLVIMIIIAPWVYFIWVGDKVVVPFHLDLLMAAYVFVRAWNNIFVYFINGVGKIKLQLYMSIIISIINIPLSIYFARELGMGVGGVILATIVCLLIGSVLHPIQYYKIIRGTAKGIWDA
jgi:O-antigen/teichoic acid export membrane protein